MIKRAISFVPRVIKPTLRFLPVAVARPLLQVSQWGSKSRLALARPQLLIDVSVIVGHDAGTGIQRTVRALTQQLLDNPPTGYDVRPVFATHKHGYRYLNHWRSSLFLTKAVARDRAVCVQAGDIFLGLDLTAHLLPKHQAQLVSWKQLGAQVHIVVYDLLPILHPEWFSKKTTKNFHRWLRSLAIVADGAICISQSVRDDLSRYLLQNFKLQSGALTLNTIPLGMDIAGSVPSVGLPANVDALFAAIQQKTTVLMVGTIEPRKGYDQALQAFEQMWSSGAAINLVIVGRKGWKTEKLQRQLANHAQKDSQLWWFEDGSDELLEKLYSVVDGVLVASKGEGYGLPLIEAIRHKKPVLARDIHVFQEIAGENVSYFDESTPEGLRRCIGAWLLQIEEGKHVCHMPHVSWQQSAQALLRCLGLNVSVLDEQIVVVEPQAAELLPVLKEKKSSAPVVRV